MSVITNNKLIQIMDREVSGDTVKEARLALSRMEGFFFDRFGKGKARGMDGWVYTALSSGGKRLRPILLWLCCGFGRPVDAEKALGLMASIELMHGASLVHDDIVDHSYLRHGKPTINAQKGDGYAARCGFAMVAAALELLMDTTDEIAALFADIPMEMCLGELRQVDIECDPETQTEEDYYQRIEKKTAKLIQGACLAGGMASEADERTLAALGEFGHALGILFQLRDDLLDYQPHSGEGKPAAQDVERGVYSLPLLYALEKADAQSPGGQYLRDVMGKTEKTPDEIRFLLETAQSSGGVSYAMAAIHRQAARAEEALSALPPGGRRAGLSCLLAAFAEGCGIDQFPTNNSDKIKFITAT